MIDFVNETEFELDLDLLEAIAKSKTEAMIEFVLTDNANIQELNRNFRGKDEPTDVLSFPYEAMPMTPIGSVIVSLDYAKAKAQELGHSVQNEIALLFIHGLLHILGFDHEIDNGEHRDEEEKLIKTFALPQSLIVRNS